MHRQTGALSQYVTLSSKEARRTRVLFVVAILFFSFYVTSIAAEKAQISWLPFMTGNRIFPYGVLLLDAKIDGVECQVQLDTGSNYKFRANEQFSSTEISRRVPLEIAGLKDVVSVPARMVDELHQGKHLMRAGSIGNALLERGSVILDLSENRFAYSDRGLLRDDTTAETFNYLTPTGWEGGYIIFPLSLPDYSQKFAMLDTGASIFGLVPIKKSVFDQLAGDERGEFDAPSHAQSVRCVTSRLNTDVKVGTVLLHNNLIGYCHNNIAALGLNVFAVLGLDAFRSGTLIIDYRSQKWKFTNGPHYY